MHRIDTSGFFCTSLIDVDMQPLADEPPSSTDKRLSTHPALRASLAAGGKLCPLRELVRLLYRVRLPNAVAQSSAFT